MGMFDYIRVELPIPGYTEIPSDVLFQTKDLDSLLETYVITEKGELYREKWDYVWNESPDAFLGGGLYRVEDSFRREYLTDIHKDVNFYIGLDNNNVWRDYYARFTEGKLTKIWYEDKQY